MPDTIARERKGGRETELNGEGVYIRRPAPVYLKCCMVGKSRDS